SFDQLLVEIHNESQGTVQFEPWSPQVLHPRQYVQANVQYNEPQQSLSVSVGLTGHSPISKLGSKVEMHLMSLPNLEIVGSGTVLLSNGNQMQDRAQRMITTTNCKSSAAILCINVDGWKSAMLFDVDLSKSGACRASEGFAAIRIQSLETNNVVDKNQQDIAVQVDAIMNDDGFNPGRDAIHVGLDIASNRTLDDDAAFVLSRPCHIGFQWSGVDAHGNLAIRSNVEPHHVRLPLSLEWNRWVHAMAVLNRGSQQYFSNAIPIALDRIGPNIEAIRMLDKQPHQLGQPLRMEVKLTDDGLSGISVVEAGWSSTGELEFYEGMTIVPAVYRERDRWILNLPTDTLPSGRSLLLVRGRDRAGNIGETCSTAIEILSTTEIADRKSAMKSTIQGKVLFVSQPQNGIAVRLLANRDGNPAGTDPPLIASTVTNTEGGFMLREIPSGKYDLEATGIVRGMREKRTQQVIVEATNGPTQVQIRLDKRP
ncbi:MAG: carboxypeptidase-like regulatory domain-containing protein, partial [Pirellula sp.]